NLAAASPTDISGICGCSTTAWIWLHDAHNAQHLGKEQHKEGEKHCFHQGSLKIVWCLRVPELSLPAKPQALLKQEYPHRRKRYSQVLGMFHAEVSWCPSCIFSKW